MDDLSARVSRSTLCPVFQVWKGPTLAGYYAVNPRCVIAFDLHPWHQQIALCSVLFYLLTPSLRTSYLLFVSPLTRQPTKHRNARDRIVSLLRHIPSIVRGHIVPAPFPNEI